MKDRKDDKDAKARADRWIAWEATFVGLLIVLGLAGGLYSLIAKPV